MSEPFAWNKSLFLFLNGSDSLYLDGVMWTLSQTVTWVPLMLLIAYILFKNFERQHVLLYLLAGALLIFATDQLSAHVIKPYFGMWRPTHDPSLAGMVDVVSGYRGGLYGFLSSHAANTFAGAMYFALLFRSRNVSLSLFCYAILASYSRIYLGVHFPLDIFAGALFGLLMGLLGYLLVHFIQQRFMPARTVFSSAYTSSGIQRMDCNVVVVTFALTLIYVLLRAIFYAVTL